MKALILIIICLALSCTSKQEKTNYSLHDYIDQKYVQPSLQKLTLLNNEQKKNRREIEVLKLWPLYLKTLKAYNQAVETDEKQKLKQTQAIINKIKQKYKELTSKTFPDIEAEYKERTKS